MKTPNVLFIATTNAGTTRWRFVNFCNAALRTGVMGAYMPWWDRELLETHWWETKVGDDGDPASYARIVGELDACARQADIIVMQLAHCNESLDVFMGLRLYGKPVLVECDDNYLSPPAYNPCFGGYTPGGAYRDIAKKQFQIADGMIVSTPYLKEVYSDWNPHVYVIPNSIDWKWWGNVKRTKKPGIRIGWIGGGGHDEDLNLLKNVVPKILKKYEPVKFVFVQGVPQWAKNKPRIECVYDWARIDKYPRLCAKQDLDIAMAPLVDNAFNRAKSNLRWLEAAALEVPCVAYIRTGNPGNTHYEQTVNDGVDGMVATSEGEFMRKLEMLIRDRKLRHGIARAAHARAKTDFNADNVVVEYARVMRECIDRGQVKKDQEAIADNGMVEVTPQIGESLEDAGIIQ